MAKEKKAKRFEISEGETHGLGGVTSIIKDTKTGVSYLLVNSGYGAGMSVLVDKDGKPLIEESDTP